MTTEIEGSTSEDKTESDAERDAKAELKDKLELARKKHRQDFKVMHKQITGEEFNFSYEDTEDKVKESSKEVIQLGNRGQGNTDIRSHSQRPHGCCKYDQVTNEDAEAKQTTKTTAKQKNKSDC